MTIGLTKKQSIVLGFIEAKLADGGIAPSFKEIAAHLESPSCSGVNRIVRALEDKGRIRRFAKRARSIEVIGPNSNCPHCGKPLGSPACREAARRSKITYSRTPIDSGALA